MDEMVRIESQEPEGIHCVENTDTITYHAIRIETQKWLSSDRSSNGPRICKSVARQVCGSLANL